MSDPTNTRPLKSIALVTLVYAVSAATFSMVNLNEFAFLQRAMGVDGFCGAWVEFELISFAGMIGLGIVQMSIFSAVLFLIYKTLNVPIKINTFNTCFLILMAAYVIFTNFFASMFDVCASELLLDALDPVIAFIIIKFGAGHNNQLKDRPFGAGTAGDKPPSAP